MPSVHSFLALILVATQKCAVSGTEARSISQPRTLLPSEEPLITLRSEEYPNIDFQLFAGDSAKWRAIRTANEYMASESILHKIGKSHDPRSETWDAAKIRAELQRGLDIYPKDADTMATKQCIADSTDEKFHEFASKCHSKMYRGIHEFRDGSIEVIFEYPFKGIALREASHGDYVAVAINRELQMPEMYVGVWKDQRAIREEGEGNKIQKHFYISRDWRFQIRRWLKGGSSTPNLAMGLHCAAKQATHADRIVSTPMREMKEIMLKNGFIETEDASQEDKQELQASGFADMRLISTPETKCPRFWEVLR